ncbi:MAG: hypothetical protein F9K44_07085 [Hyphomicrobiaceae bacterium]|nr:MAG: hypothetical protein F9K44_07085 [Hyphomicrobiaceae bacterium]
MRASAKDKSAPRFTRRAWLGVPVTGGIAWLLGRTEPASAQQSQKASLLAKAVASVPEDAQDPRWQGADSLDVPLAPQAVVKPRLFEAGIKSLTARALYDGERLGVHLTWRDASSDALIGGPASFRDAIALEFPGDPAAGIPYFAMGEPDKPVVIYQWKADWQFAEKGDEEGLHPRMVVDWYPFSGRAAGEIAKAADYAKSGDRTFITSWQASNSLGDRDLQLRTPVEKLEAEGFGTLTTLPADRQDARGKATWKDGVWSLVLILPRAQARFSFAPGMTIPIAFAAWDGAKRERGGEKAVSTWYFMSLEKPISTLAYVSPVLAFLGVAAAQAWGLRWLRQRAERDRKEG